MERKFVNYTVEGRIAVVTIDNPPMNPLSGEVTQEISDVVKEVNVRADVGVVIFTGGGTKAFVAGADIKGFNANYGHRDLAFQGCRFMQQCFSDIENSPKAVIAAVNGFALGGGLELALACDVRIAAENARLGVPEIKLGIIPGAGGTQRLVRQLGKGQAKLLVLSGEFLTARQALEIGLVEKVVPVGEALGEAKALAAKFLANAPLAITNGKRAINEGSNMTLEDGLLLEANLVADLFITEDLLEGATAFIEKRPALFQGK